MIGTQRRDVERVATYSGAALELAQRADSSVVDRKLHSLRPQLQPFLGDARIGQIDKQIEALTSYLDD